MINEKPMTNEELLQTSMKYLEETRFNFALFVDHFKRYVERLIKLQEVKNG